MSDWGNDDPIVESQTVKWGIDDPIATDQETPVVATAPAPVVPQEQDPEQVIPSPEIPKEARWAESVLRRYHSQYQDEIPPEKSLWFSKAKEIHSKAFPKGTGDGKFDSWVGSVNDKAWMKKAAEGQYAGPKIESLDEAMMARHGTEESPAATFVRKLPFAGSVFKTAELIDLKKSAGAVRNGTATDGDYLRVAKSVDQAEKSEDASYAQNVWDVVSDIPAFGIEFALTGGAYTAGRKLMERGVERVAWDVVKRGIAGLATRTLGRAAGVAAHTLANPQLIASETARKMVPEFGLSKDDNGVITSVISDNDPSFLEALTKGAGSASVEIGSERAGAALEWLGSGLAKLPVASRVAALKSAVVKKWLGSGKTVGQFATVLKEAGWHGILGEMFEERVGEVAKGAAGIEDNYGTTGDIAAGRWKEAIRQLATEATAFAIPGVVSHGVGAAIDKTGAAITNEQRGQRLGDIEIARKSGLSGADARMGADFIAATNSVPDVEQWNRDKAAYVEKAASATDEQLVEAFGHPDLPAPHRLIVAKEIMRRQETAPSEQSPIGQQTDEQHQEQTAPEDASLQTPVAETEEANSPSDSVSLDSDNATTNEEEEEEATTSESAAKASVPVMITKEMRNRLSQMGKTEDEIKSMTPEEAWQFLDQAASGTVEQPKPTAATKTPLYRKMAEAAEKGLSEVELSWGDWHVRELTSKPGSYGVVNAKTSEQVPGYYDLDTAAIVAEKKHIDEQAHIVEPSPAKKPWETKASEWRGNSQRFEERAKAAKGTPYVQVTRDLGQGRRTYEAYDLDGNLLSKSPSIAGPQSNQGRFNRRKGQYENVVRVNFQLGKDESFSPEWLRSQLADYDRDAHQMSVQQALEDGEPVPAEVLADYPNLKPSRVAESSSEVDASRLDEKMSEPSMNAAGYTVGGRMRDAITRQWDYSTWEKNFPATAEKLGEAGPTLYEKVRSQIIGESSEIVNEPIKQPTVRPKTSWHGDAAEYTGKTEQLHEGLFHEVEIMEGAHKGEKKLTQVGPDGNSPYVAESKKAWEDQQADFSRLHESESSSASEEPPAESTRGDSMSPLGLDEVSENDLAKELTEMLQSQPEAKQPKRIGEKTEKLDIVRSVRGRANAANKEVSDALDEFAAVLKNRGLYSNPFADPELIGAAAKLTAKLVKAGVPNFADAVNTLADRFGADLTGRLAPLLERSWEHVRSKYNPKGMSQSGKVSDILSESEAKPATQPESEEKNETPDERSQTLESRGVEDGLGQHGSDASETSRRVGRKRQTGKRDHREGKDVSGNDPENERTSTADAGRRDPGNRSGRISDARESDVAGREATDEGRESGAQGVSEEPVEAHNHVIGADDSLAVASKKESLRRNLRAIELLKTLENEGRSATPEEKKSLAQFTGWGGLSQAFDRRWGEPMEENAPSWRRNESWEKEWGKAYAALKKLLTAKEWEVARDTTINAHYTSRLVIEKMWSLVDRLGFRGGRVLEPGAGIGHFAGLIPDKLRSGTKFTMVEMDSLSSRMLQKLYPEADVRGVPFEDYRVSPGSVDLVIGNVPFAAEGPADAKKRYGVDLNLHNYFIARSLDAVRPGGLVVVISTHNTLDSAQEQRKLIAEKGDLVGAIRLPNNAFAENAKTEVVTDILVFRRPVSGERIGRPFTSTMPIELKDSSGHETETRINQYFVEHPEQVLGKQALTGTMYHKNEYTVEPEPSLGNLESKLDVAVLGMPENIAGDVSAEPRSVDAVGDYVSGREGELTLDGGKLMVTADGKSVPVVAKKPIEGYPRNLFTDNGIKRAAQYIAIRDSYRKLREVMLSPESSDKDVSNSQKQMEKLYDAYVAKHGRLNGAKTNIFQMDPEFYRVLSLEDEKTVFDTPIGKFLTYYTKAPVFTTRTLGPRRAPDRVESVKDGLWVSVGYRGKVDVDYVAQLTGKTPEAVASQLADTGLAYRDPVTQQYVLSSAYLSGNVKQKLRAAETASQDDPEYQRNVKALKAVQPAPLGIAKISYRLGANWIPANVVQRFATGLFGTNTTVQYVPGSDTWIVTASRHAIGVSQTWGTSRVTGVDILSDALNLHNTLVYDAVETGELDDRGRPKTTRVLNEKETQAAKAKAHEMQKQFVTYVQANHDAASQMEAVYNDKFNAYVDAVYDGSHLELPGAAREVSLRPYQKNAIWRILQDGCALLAHAVGAGKTYTLAGAAMEMRRLGLAKRPLLVVQNATLGQFATSFMKMYPNANVLVADKDDLSTSNRQLFLSRVTSGDWDAVVMAQSTFDRLSSKPDVEMQYIHDMLTELEDAIKAEGGERSREGSVKDLVRARNGLRNRLDKLLASEKENREKNRLYFDDLDVDALFLDEAHAYKKPFFLTKLQNLVGLNKQASARGVSTMLKVRTVQSKMGGRNVILATGTPITNTLGEAWHMVNFVNPRLNEEFGVNTFDGFVGAFAVQDTVREMNAGGQWVLKDALVRFTNGPELLRYLRAAWDILSPNDLKAYMQDSGSALPSLRGGKVQAVTVDRTPGAEKFMKFLEQVYAKFKSLPPKERRVLSYIPAVAYGAARAASLDIRLVHPNAKEEIGGKVSECVRLSLEEYKRSSENRGVQLIFSDTFNPRSMATLHSFMAGEEVDLNIQENSDAVSGDDSEAAAMLFQDIKKKLMAAGVPEREIAIVAEANTDARRDALFARAQSGDVRFLLGSSAKMGVGVNVQNKLVALHHLDAPWLPADVEQREGRIIRFGNENKEVSIYRYAMKNTLDAAIFNKTNRKAKFIWQVLTGKSEGREFEDPASEMTMSIEEQLAAIEGDPLLFEKMEIDRQRRELELEKESHFDAVARARETIREHESDIKRVTTKTIPLMEQRAKELRALDMASPNLKIGGKTYSKSEEAEKALKGLVESHLSKIEKAVKNGSMKAWRPSGMTMLAPTWKDYVSPPFEIAGMQARVAAGAWQQMSVDGATWESNAIVSLALPSNPDINLYTGSATTVKGLWTAARGLADAQEGYAKGEQHAAEQKQKEIKALKDIVDKPWDGQDKLDKASRRLEEIESELVAKGAAKAAAAHGPRSDSVSPQDDETDDATRDLLRIGGKPRRLGQRSISRQDVVSVFPGAKITPAKNGWHVEIGDSYLTIEKTDNIDIDWSRLEARGIKVSSRHRAKIAAAGAFSVNLPDGTKHSGLGLIRLREGLADSSVLRHEALHLARRAGLFGEAEWQALVDAHAKGETNPKIQEERIAQAQENEGALPSVLDRIRSWIRRILASVGIGEYDARDIHAMMREAGFWTRKGSNTDNSGTMYSLRGRPDLANPATDVTARRLVDDVDENRNLTGAPSRRSDMDVDAEADRRLKADYPGELSALLKKGKTGGQLSDVETVMAKKIVNREALSAMQSADPRAIADAMSLIESYRNTGAEQARAFRQRVDPVESPAERMARMLSEAILAPPENLRKKRDALRKAGNDEAADQINEDWAKKFQELKDRLKLLGVDIDNLHELGYSKIKAARALRVIAQAKASKWDKMHEYWLCSILYAPTTQAANIIGNVGHAAWHFTAERFTEALVNTVAQREEGARWGEFKEILGGILPGLARGARNFVATWDAESPTLESEIGRSGIGKLEDRSAIGGTAGRVIRTPLRLLSAVDDFCKSLFVQMEVGARAYRIAKAEGITGDDLRIRIAQLTADIESPAWDEAYDTTLNLAFQQEGSPLGQNIKRHILAGRRDIPGLRYLIPFVTTPMNIFATGVKKSPLGSVHLSMKMYDNYQNGMPALRGLTADVAQQVIAWAIVLSLLGNGDDDPWITGTEGELTRGSREVSNRTRPSQSVKVGGKWYSYARIEPFATALGLAVDWVNAIKSGDPKRTVVVPFNSLVGQTKNKTFLSGVGDLLRALEADQPEEKLARWASDFTVSWVPNLIRSGGRSLDDDYPNRRVWGNGLDWWARLGRRTLQKTEVMPIRDYPIYDVWGRPAKKTEVPAMSDWLYRMVVPIRAREDQTFVADRLILNYNNKNSESEQFPKCPDPNYERDGKTVYMTDGQYADFVRLSGEASRAALIRVDLDADDPQRRDVEWIQEITSAARSEVKSRLVETWNGGKAEIGIDAIADHVVGKSLKGKIEKAVLSYDMPERKRGEPEESYAGRVRKWQKSRDKDEEWLRAHEGDEAVRKAIEEAAKSPKFTERRTLKLTRNLSTDRQKKAYAERWMPRPK